MTKLLSLVLPLTAGLVAAAPHGYEAQDLEKRQGLSDIIPLLGPGLFSLKGQQMNDILDLGKYQSTGKLGWFMGEPRATDVLSTLAQVLNAKKDSPGTLGDYTIKNLNKGWGLQGPAPAGSAPPKEVIKSRTDVPGAQTIKMRYGPYKVPSSKIKNMLGEEGMLSNFPHMGMEKPCDGDCTIIGMESGLEYLNGTNANIDTGLWLHHMVLFNRGPGREDLPCSGRDISVPHSTIGATPRSSERIFASGNERSVASFPAWGVKDAGYKLKKEDTFAALVELMNMNPVDQNVWMTVTYDIVPGHPYKDDIKVIWFDVRQCGTSEVNPPEGKNQFTLDYTWTVPPTFKGEVIGSIGHGHDGATETILKVDGKSTCTNPAKYGTKPEWIQKPMEGGHGHGATLHISDMAPCYGAEIPSKTMTPGQNWTLVANYDFDKNKGNVHEDMAADGSMKITPDEVMGIAITFVRVKGA